MSPQNIYIALGIFNIFCFLFNSFAFGVNLKLNNPVWTLVVNFSGILIGMAGLAICLSSYAKLNA